MDAISFLDHVKSSKDYHGQVVWVHRVPRRRASYRELDPPLAGDTEASLKRVGISRLYSHQAQAIEAARRGEHVVVVTATASGKTLCYNIPVMEALDADPRGRALYIYPTKALAQDQLGKLRQFENPRLKVATFDGDTPRQERPYVKQAANVVLTNPDMLHLGILPYHGTWSGLLRNLKYVVIDEVHTYRGVFGAHVGNVIRRLRRIARYYGSAPTFICSSATVRDPGKLVKDLTGLDARVIDNDGSPGGEKVFVFWNPPYLAGKEERRSANSEAVGLLARLVESGVRTIVFTKARVTAEVILRYARDKLREIDPERVNKIMAYRGGYRPDERREIERRLFHGDLIGVTSTNALEVGVDIGGLDAVVMTGYPGTVASTWQQAGRAGRGREQSMAVLVALEDPIDQYLMRNPDYFFTSEHERAIVDPTNPYILVDHILCAAYELPLENDEAEELFGEHGFEVMGALGEYGELSYRGKWYWTGADYPAGRVNIRSASGASYDIVSVEDAPVIPNGCEESAFGASKKADFSRARNDVNNTLYCGRLLGTVDADSAFTTVYPGAVYLHAGESYVVTRLDLIEKAAYVERSQVDYYTVPGSTTRISMEEERESMDFCGWSASFGDVIVTNQVTHFMRKRLFTDKVIERVPLDLPESEFNTEAAWFAIPPKIRDRAIGRGFDLAGAIHAIEHASIGILPLFALCDRNDIGGVSHPSHPDMDGDAAIFIYDGYAGGVGLSRAAYEQIETLLAAALRAIEDCPCDDGCPSCIQSPKCGNNNDPLDKQGAVFLLREMLGSSAALMRLDVKGAPTHQRNPRFNTSTAQTPTHERKLTETP